LRLSTIDYSVLVQSTYTYLANPGGRVGVKELEGLEIVDVRSDTALDSKARSFPWAVWAPLGSGGGGGGSGGEEEKEEEGEEDGGGAKAC
jgi:hypothetical protein